MIYTTRVEEIIWEFRKQPHSIIKFSHSKTYVWITIDNMEIFERFLNKFDIIELLEKSSNIVIMQYRK